MEQWIFKTMPIYQTNDLKENISYKNLNQHLKELKPYTHAHRLIQQTHILRKKVKSSCQLKSKF